MIALIMAGGSGTRFWPLSRKTLPKQYLNVQGSTSMLQKTVQRLLSQVAMHDIYIVTTQDQKELVKQHLPRLPEENIILEPFGMNTAPCIALSVEYLKARYAESEVMLVLPADHVIRDVNGFLHSLVPAEAEARNGNLITFGIVPDYPATGYGYIEAGEKIKPGVHRVTRFKEKPDRETAEQFINAGNFFWNSGMFCWSISAISQAFEQHLPEAMHIAARIADHWEANGLDADVSDLYRTMPKLPIDIGIMEKADNCCVIPVSYGWSDVGSWKALAEITPCRADNNYFSHSGVALSAKDNYINTHKFTAVIGLNDICLVETDDAILVCAKDQAERVKDIVNYLKERGEDRLL